MIAGRYAQSDGPARTFSPMNVWNMRLRTGRSVSFDLQEGHAAALFVLHGAIHIGTHTVREAELAVMERTGSQLVFGAADDTLLLLLSGEPLNEPVVGRGPFVMNMQQEIVQAMRDYGDGKFGHMPSPE